MIELDENYVGQMLSFRTIEEFDSFTKDQKATAMKNGINIKEKSIEINIPVETMTQNQNGSIVSLDGLNYTLQKVYSASHHWSQWAPYSNIWVTGPFATKHIYFDYDFYYTNRVARYTNVYNLHSSLSGLNWGGWQHIKGNIPSYSQDRRTAYVSVEGNYFFGISIAGVPVGYVDPATWSCSVTLYAPGW